MAMSNFNQRLLTSIVLIVALVILFVLRFFVDAFGMYAFDVVVLAGACLSAWEFCHAKKLDQRGANAYVAFIVYGLVYMFYLIGSEILTTKLPVWLQIVVSLLIIGVFTLFIGLSNMMDKKMAKNCQLQKKDFNHEAWGGAWDLIQMIIYPGCLFACVILLNHINRYSLGAFGMLLLVMISCFTDTFAYLVGSLLGKNTKKMAPKLSPKKTWIGFVGGLFGGILGALITVWIIANNGATSQYLVGRTGDAWLVQLDWLEWFSQRLAIYLLVG